MNFLSFKHRRPIIAAATIAALAALTIGAVYHQPLSAGTQAVTAVVDRSDRNYGLRWRAFALGVVLVALVVVLADAMRPDWMHAHAVLHAVATILAAGLACALLATVWPAFERLFLQLMIRHHQGALTMVSDLMSTSGSARNEQIFNYATDINADQSAEIQRMQTLLRDIQ